jgi:uncharacterized C2H2 Zn-finger protein
MNLAIVSCIIIFVVLVIIFAVGVLLSRGKQLKCPDCNRVFNAPFMEEKRWGGGWTFPFMGAVKCPKCGNRRSRRDYIKVEEQIEKIHR